jgi:hypothetical protein
VLEALKMPHISELRVEAENISERGEVTFSPHLHLCAPQNARILSVGGAEADCYGPGMHQMARDQKQYSLGEFVSHRSKLRDVDAAKNRIEPQSAKVVLDPWS